jgi:hypothetical protein
MVGVGESPVFISLIREDYNHSNDITAVQHSFHFASETSVSILFTIQAKPGFTIDEAHAR